MKHYIANILCLIVILGIAFAAFGGYIMNIFKVFGNISTVEAIIRVVGIVVPPAGALMGWL